MLCREASHSICAHTAAGSGNSNWCGHAWMRFAGLCRLVLVLSGICEFAPCAAGHVLIPEANKVHSSQQRCHNLKERPVQPGVYCYQYLVDGTWMTSPDVPVGPDDDGHLCNKARSCTWPGCESSLWPK